MSAALSRADLERLANAPGAGTARAALIKAGAWDDYAGLPERTYLVKVDYEIQHEGEEYLTVSARDPQEAKDLAYRKFAEDVAGLCDYEIDVTGIEVVDP